MQNVKVSNTDITMGKRLNRSVFNDKGELLLKKGKVISTEHQFNILLGNGFFMDKAPQPKNRQRRVDSPRTFDLEQENIFDIKERWIAELYSLLIGSQKTQVEDFSHRVLSLALEIQLQAKNQHDNLLASLQLDFDSHYGLIHALHCAVSCEMIGLANSLGQVERLMVVAAALTHDIGIIIEQEFYTQIKGRLSPEQQTAVKQHPLKSETLLRHLGVRDQLWLDAVRHHHERLDGSGYPDALSAEQLTKPARILAIADIYSAIVHPTAFRRHNSGKYALTTLFQARGKQFDKTMVERFIAQIGIYPPGSLVRLKNNEVGIVANQSDAKHQPVVAVLISGSGDIYHFAKMRDSSLEQYAIVREEPIEKFNILRDKMEKLFLT